MLALLLAAAVASSPAPAPNPKDVIVHLCAESYLNDLTHPNDKPNVLLDQVLKDIPKDTATHIRNECSFFNFGVLFDLQLQMAREIQADENFAQDLPVLTKSALPTNP